ncbi:MAG: TetR/AcrR family transcriptional regulator [Fusobacterium sp.]|uniref:TetR/AcrR family transcriptional regulator n=1 Tax=Fusobacterium sp. TaxID=68766 RepID=UPI0026DB5C32|nr:TetR/AcrR family transcriptional regulator [Fusobacterium sp.]MDO4690714.1 TetR/AcrR family transcriptional regulator [Fusobacterium sp.]
MESTKGKIINSAIELFSSKPFEEVSVSEICRNANISNGIIYKYFKTKEEIYKFLLSETIVRIDSYLSIIEGDTIEERLKDFIKKNLDLTRKEIKLIRIYRDGQYKFLEYEKKLKKVYNRSLENVYKRKLKIIEKFFILSTIRHINIYFITKNIEIDIDFLVRSLLYGFLYQSKRDTSILHDGMFYLRIPFNSANVKCKILNVGSEILSNQEYNSIKISDITSKAGISSGAFYLYFKNKDSFLKTVVLRIRKQILFFLKDNFNLNYTPLDNHLMFLYLLFEYYKDSYFKYKLLREMELIDSKIYEKFMDEDVDFYLETLHDLNYNFHKRRIIAVMLLGISHYMGIEFFYTKEFKNRDLFLEEIKKLIQNGLEK